MSKDIAIKEIKRNLRTSIKSKLSQVPLESIKLQSIDVANALFKVPQFITAKKIALYMNMPNSEVQTKSIIKYCFDLKKQVYLPKCNKSPQLGRNKNHLTMLKIQRYEDVLQLQPQGKYKLLEPIHGDDAMESGDLDVIIVPGVAFTKEKRRLGHGAGFYDEFLSFYSKKFGKRPYLIGIGLKEQLVDEIPKEDHDWDLDCLIINGFDVRY